MSSLFRVKAGRSFKNSFKDDLRKAQRAVVATQAVWRAALFATGGAVSCEGCEKHLADYTEHHHHHRHNLAKIMQTRLRFAAALTVSAWASPALAHIVLENGQAPVASYYKAVLQVGHGCQGAATTAVAVTLPVGFKGAKPMPKVGWAVTAEAAPVAAPYDRHGQRVTEDVRVVRWTAASPAGALPDAHYDEFVLRGQLPDAPGPLWFAVRQSCGAVVQDWLEVPATGTSTTGLTWPAARLLVTPVATAQPAGLTPSPAARSQVLAAEIPPGIARLEDHSGH